MCSVLSFKCEFENVLASLANFMAAAYFFFEVENPSDHVSLSCEFFSVCLHSVFICDYLLELIPINAHNKTH
jgi:hypothetical protein